MCRVNTIALTYCLIYLDGEVNICAAIMQVSEEESNDDTANNENTNANTDVNANVNNHLDETNSLIEHEIQNSSEQGGATSFVVEDSDKIIQESQIFLPADYINNASYQQLLTNKL